MAMPAFFASFIACKTPSAPVVSHYTSDKTKKMNLPFSDAVIVGNMIYLSGNLGNQPGTFKLVEGGIRAEAKQTMENIKTVLEANGSSLEDIIKCTVFIEDIKEWGIFNEEYVKFFPGKKPARSALGADGLALGARVEVECIACKQCKKED
jgi:reactive intermediate/imine deaminase